MESYTHKLGHDTQKVATNRFSILNVTGKDPNYDYSFRLFKDIEQGNGMDSQGFEPINASNHSGEAWDGPDSMRRHSANNKQIIIEDVILCRRPKETSRYFKEIEDRRYNSQIKLVKNAAKMAKAKMRPLGDLATLRDESKGISRLQQRPGPSVSAKDPILEDSNG